MVVPTISTIPSISAFRLNGLNLKVETINFNYLPLPSPQLQVGLHIHTFVAIRSDVDEYYLVVRQGPRPPERASLMMFILKIPLPPTAITRKHHPRLQTLPFLPLLLHCNLNTSLKDPSIRGGPQPLLHSFNFAAHLVKVSQLISIPPLKKQMK